MPTSVLEPGKTASVAALFPVIEGCWRFDVAYTRLDLAEHLTDKARNARSVIVRTVANKLSPSAKLRWTSGWITNSPPSAIVSRYRISAPPPEIPIELLPKPKPE